MISPAGREAAPKLLSSRPQKSFSLQQKWSLRVIALFGAHMLHSLAPIGAQKIKAQTVFLFVHYGHKPGPQRRPLRRVHQAFEYGKLNTLPPVLAVLRYLPQTFFSGGILRADIVTD